MKFFINLICILSIVTTAFAKDEWLNYSSPFPIKSAVPYGDGFLMGTGGGVRYRTNTADDMYTTSNGLGDQSISAVAISDSMGTFAVSDKGIISLMGANGHWQVFSRSYAGSNTYVIPGMVRLGGRSGSIMVIAFADRLSFFSLKSMSSILTIERIADESLFVNPVGAMEVRGDSLFVAVGNSLYVRKMNWETLESDVQLNNPDTWRVVKEGANKDVIKSIAWKNGKVKTFSTVGTRIWDQDGETVVAVDTFSVFSSSAPLVVVRGKTLKDSILYELDSIPAESKDEKPHYYYRSLVQWVTLLPNGTAILAGPNNIFYYDGKKIKDLTEYKRFALGSAYELQALAKGGVLAASEKGQFSFNLGYEWSEPTRVYENFGNKMDARAHDLKVMSVLSGGVTYYHLWGYGSFLYQEWGDKLYQSMLPDGDNCMDDYFKDSEGKQAFVVSSTPAPNDMGFILATSSTKGYSLVYIDIDGRVSCANNIGSGAIASAIIVQVNDEGNWVAYVGTRHEMTLAAEGGLDVITFPRPGSTGGELSPKISKENVKTYYGPSTTPLDMVYESKSGYFWIVTETSLLYWNPEQDSLRNPLSTNGLTGSGFTSIDADSRGNLWVGTSTQGAFRLTPRTTSPDTLSVQRFTTRHGLLSDRIQDIAVDSVLGFVWFAHENGISRYRRNDLRGTDGNMTEEAREGVKVYPNPFRPKMHPFVLFDNVSDDAVIGVYNRGGKLVVSLKGGGTSGGRVEWDGKMSDGSLVAPGVYQYVIRGASNVKKGKLLIIH